VMKSRLLRRMVLPREKTSLDRRSLQLATTSTDDGIIRTFRGKARCKSPFLAHQMLVFFCTSNKQGGQDHAFQFRGGLAHYRAHTNLSYFRTLLGGNRPTSNGLILNMNRVYNGGEQRAREVHVVKGEMILYPCLKGEGHL
jgi:hypothetical protein